MTAGAYDVFTVPVRGGEMAVGRWHGRAGAPTVVLVHGITGTHRSWTLVADALGDAVTVVAPDLRGRGASNRLGGPFGMAAHADDVIALIDHLELGEVALVGHSMGGFVSTVTAMNFPHRVTRVLLVDGGLSLAVPQDTDVDAVLEAVLGPSLARLSMTFATRDAYRAFWLAHPALGPYWNDAIAGYVDYDVEGEEPALRSRASLDAVRADGADTLLVPDAATAITKLACPVTLLRAERGMFDEPAPLYPDALVAAVRALAPNLGSDTVVSQTNHYTITLTRAGAEVIAQHIIEPSPRIIEPGEGGGS
jgi:pimeloyl-ACP methyl ester carboxylesterase